MKRLDLGYNANGTRSEIYVGDNEIVTRDIQDVSGILANNERARNSAGKAMGRNGYLAAEIPITIYHEWRKDWRKNHSDKWEWKTYLAQKLNSKDWLKLRTNESRI